MNYTESHLWKSTLAVVANDTYEEERQLLRDAYNDLRKNIAQLVENISADLRQFSVHDITHLDALWGIASEIVGENYQLNPLEGFILGGAILTHDAGMCLASYPGGIRELQAHKLWRPTLLRFVKNVETPTEAEISLTVASLLRTEHASRARELMDVTWRTSDGVTYQLIEKTEIRQKFGNWIGDVAASHWWSHDKIAHSCDRILAAPPPFPTEWHIDLLKVASILRVSDAAHIDERRAPGFIRALRTPFLGELSDRHWLFQSRLTQPERRLDALHYNSTSDFQISEAEAWWLAYDTLSMIDTELRQTDVLLADLRGDECRFAARRVANVESTKTMVMSINVDGWIPIDTKIRISNVPHLIQTLGGKALYGGNALTTPIRELVQNAADAIRLKANVLPSFTLADGKIEVKVEELNGENYLTVTDNGIGMTRDIISGPFLDFGESGWMSDPAFQDYPAADPQTVLTIGKFGIGFFSSFIIGNEIDVITRRFDRSFDETLVMSFSGVSSRPILRSAQQHEWLTEGGTTVRILLHDAESFLKQLADRSLKAICQYQIPLLDIKLHIIDKGVQSEISPVDWKTMDPSELLARINEGVDLPASTAKYISNIRPLFDLKDNMIGRAFLAPRDYEHEIGDIQGIVFSRGIFACSMSGIYGVIEGDINLASRHSATPKVKEEELHRWLNEQRSLIEQMHLSPNLEESCASVIHTLGGDTGDLKICRNDTKWLSKTELYDLASKFDEIVLVFDLSFREIKQFNPTARLKENAIGIEMGSMTVFRGSGLWDIDSTYGPYWERSLESLATSIIGRCWNLDVGTIDAIKHGIRDETGVVGTTSENQEIQVRATILRRGMRVEKS